MKKILFLILLSIPVLTFAQDAPQLPVLPIDSATKQITYKAIVEVPGVTAADIYSRSREWFATAFKSANSVLQMDDKAAGKLIGKGVFMHSYLIKAGFGVTAPMSYTIGFTINVTVKEGKYRVIITDFTGTNTSPGAASTSGSLETLYTNADSFKKMTGKMNKQVYGIFVQMFTDVDTDTKATIANLQKAVITKVKDDF